MQREMASKFEPDSDYTNVRELTIQNTNEVACYVCFRHSKRVCRCSDCLGNLIGTHILG